MIPVKTSPHLSKAGMFVPGHDEEGNDPCPPIVRKIIRHINLPRKILNLLVGKNHPIWSRLLIGLFIMIVAEFFTEGGIVFRLLASLIRDTGGIPWLEAIVIFANTEL